MRSAALSEACRVVRGPVFGWGKVRAEPGPPVPVVASNGGVKPAVTNGVTVMFPRNRPSAKRDSCRSSGPGGQIAFDGSH